MQRRVAFARMDYLPNLFLYDFSELCSKFDWLGVDKFEEGPINKMLEFHRISIICNNWIRFDGWSFTLIIFYV